MSGSERWRDLAGPVGILETGPRNAITDVDGIRVGHSQSQVGEASGVTVIDPGRLPVRAGTSVVNGTGVLSASLEIDEWGEFGTPVYLCGTHAVGTVYQQAIVASGLGPEYVTIPVVGECDDGLMADSRKIVSADVDAAREALAAGVVAEGTVGAGTGMSCFDFPGGIGTASRRAGDWTVAVLLLCNFGDRERLDLLGHRLDPAPPPDKAPDGSCIAVCATDAPLDALGLRRLALRPLLGLARAGSYASNGSGEIGLAFSTAPEIASFTYERDEPAVRRRLGGCARGGHELPRRGPAGHAARRLPSGRLPARARPRARRAGPRAVMEERVGAAAIDERTAAEVVELCRDLIRVDTSNPPGNETPAAELLAGYLEIAGEGRIEVELAGPDPERLNVIARIPGAGEGPSLMMLGHTDVVPAPADSGWTVPPFEGRIEDARIIGRGAADMKGELAARAAALTAFARSGRTPAGDIVLISESDEERGVSDVGVTWLVRERPEIRCDYAVNEGAGVLFELADGRRVVTVGIGEKVVTSVRIRLHGQGGHASTPLETENPLTHAAEAISRLTSARGERNAVPAVQRAFEQLGIAGLGDEELIAWCRSQHPLLAPELDAMVRLTVTPTGVQSYAPANVIPGYVDITCDCRLVPGGSDPLAEIEAHVAAAMAGGPAYELELLEPPEGGTESAAEGPLYEAIAAYVERAVPGAVLLPILGTGFSDTAYIREAFGSSAFGFAPVLHTDPATYFAGMHSSDESLAIADLHAIADFHLHAIEAFAG